MERHDPSVNRNRLVLFFLLRILLVTWIPLILLTVVFFVTSLRAQRERIVDGNVKLFESSINNYDFIFDNFFGSTGDLLYLPEAHELAQDESPLDERSAILVLQQEMARLSGRFDMIGRTGLYLSDERLMLRPDGFQNAVELQQEQPETSRVLSNLPGFGNRWIPQHSVETGFRSREVVEYIMPLSSNRERPYGAFVFTFPVESLLNLFAVQQGESFFLVSDAPGSVLFGNRDSRFLDRLTLDLDVARLLRERSVQTRVLATDTRFILQKASPVSDLAYVLVMPENPLNDELSLSPSIIFLAAVVLLLSLVLTLLFTNYVAQPVAEVISAVDLEVAGDRDSGVSKWSVIFHRLHSGHLADDVSIGRLVAEHRSVASVTLTGLLLGNAELSGDLRSMLEELGLDGPLFSAFVVDVGTLPPSRLEEQSWALLNRLPFPDSLYACALPPSTIAVVVSGSSAHMQRGALLSLADRILSQLSGQVSEPLVSVGPVVSDASRLAASYDSATRGVRCSPTGVVDATRVGTQHVAYPFARVRVFLDAIRAGNQEGAVRHLAELCAAIRKKSEDADPAEVIRTYTSLHHDIAREGFDLSVQADPDHGRMLWALLEAPRLDHAAVHEVLEGEVRDVTVSLSSVRGQDPGEAVHLVSRYICENYRRDISLDELAEVAGLTSQYLSTLFKRRKGTTIVSYITRLRLEAARAMLHETDKSVAEVAEAVGYSNPQYFTRVFKREMSLSPLQYRKAQPGGV